MDMWFSQLVGGIACLIGISAFLQKDDLRFRYQMVVYCLVIGVHFALMGATVAAIGVVLNALRSYASIKTRSLYVMWGFIILMWAMTATNITHFWEFMTVFGSSISTYALFTQSGIKLRSLMLFNSVCWVSHNIWVGSFGGTVVEAAFIVTNVVTIGRLYMAGKKSPDAAAL